MWVLTQRLLQPLLSLHHILCKQPRSTCLLLKLAAEVVEAHVSYLEVRGCNAARLTNKPDIPAASHDTVVS